MHIRIQFKRNEINQSNIEPILFTMLQAYRLFTTYYKSPNKIYTQGNETKIKIKSS